jgi:murein DD-endopeptidase MepM/ murein hydrolase activator NlpD
MKLFTLLFLFVTLSAAATGKERFQLNVDHKSREQGQFFTVTVTGAKAEPTISFMSHTYRMFRQADGSWRSLLPVENLTIPGSYTLVVRERKYEKSVSLTVIPNNRRIQQITLDPSKRELKATGTELTKVKTALHTESLEKLFAGTFLRPAPGETSSLFGLRRSYNGGPVESYHKGIDISAPQGTPVKSSAKGNVVLTGRVEDGFQVHGNTVIIDHGQGLTTIYMHLSAITVTEGQCVDAGEIIGTVGHTGISTAPHLHWGTYLYGTSVDPELFEGHAF